MAFNYKTDNILKDFYAAGGRTRFPESLKNILESARKDKNLVSEKHLAYLLGTAKAESDYSLQRWEADYLCGSVGKPYQNKPCQKALDYYRSTSGNKTNYYNLGTDSRGLPYFGRGLIQLTGKENYKKYGDMIGVNLLNYPDTALVPENSYKVAVAYMNNRNRSGGKSTFDFVDEGDLTKARRTVNGGTNGLTEVNEEFRLWSEVFEKNKVEPKEFSDKNIKIVAISISLSVIVAGAVIYYLIYRKKNKK